MKGSDIKAIRILSKKSQGEFGEMFGLQQPHISAIEKGKQNISTELENKITKYAQENDIDLGSIISEPPAEYHPKKIQIDEISEYYKSDLNFRVTEMNGCHPYKVGQILACKLVDHLKFFLLGVPYVITTATDRISFMRYLTGKTPAGYIMKYSIDEVEGQEIPSKEIGSLYIVTAELNRVF